MTESNKYLVETALLTHGIRSVSNEEILRRWPDRKQNIVFLDRGEIRITDIESYLAFRVDVDSIHRVDMDTIEEAICDRRSAALTASATMRVCAERKIPYAVTAGMGGIGAIEGEELCPDLPALEKLSVKLISCGPKDMLDRRETYRWLKDRGVIVTDLGRNFSTGYVFCGEKIAFSGCTEEEFLSSPHGLLVHEIPESERIEDMEILRRAVREGYKKQREGANFHPAVNGALDSITGGYSSILQLDGLIANIKQIEKIIVNMKK